jgi:hypothetical protein
MTNHPYQFFILTASDGESVNGLRIASRAVARDRLHRGAWALYENTRNRESIRVGDRLLIYATGGLFIGSATVAEVVRSSSRIRQWKDGDLLVLSPVAAVLIFSNVEFFDEPVVIQDLLSQLSFVPQHKKWGVVLLGGALRIDKSDWDIVQSAAKKLPR